MTNTSTGRRYGGQTAQDRQQQRREALIAAGVELFGTIGYPNVSVKRVCDAAGLTQRYFYESFADREALLGAVYTHCVDTARAATLAAAAEVLAEAEVSDGPVPAELVPRLADVALHGFIAGLSGDPRAARIIMIEVVGVSPALETLRLQAIHGWAELILGFVTRGQEPTSDQRLAAIGLVGALTQLLVDWQTALGDPVDDGYDADLFDIEAIGRVVTEMMVGTYTRMFDA